MHKELKKRLVDAQGFSAFAVAVTVDIRGFSAFSNTQESPAVAEFLKKAYMKILDLYFTDLQYFKPIGDGLLMIRHYKGNSDLPKVATETIGAALRLLSEFPSFLVGDPMINFDVPQKVGIGLARGVVCGLRSRTKMLDYSGRPLNLSSRLVDLARPGGIVFDADFGPGLLPEDLLKHFKKESVFIPGIAEREPITIFYTVEQTVISPRSKKPIIETKWKTLSFNKTLKEINRSGRFRHALPSTPLDPKDITIQLTYPAVVKGRRAKGFVRHQQFNDFSYVLDAGRPIVVLSYDVLGKLLRQRGVKDNWETEISVRYPEG